jgi:hypothetical protein
VCDEPFTCARARRSTHEKKGRTRENRRERKRGGGRQGGKIRKREGDISTLPRSTVTTSTECDELGARGAHGLTHRADTNTNADTHTHRILCDAIPRGEVCATNTSTLTQLQSNGIARR